MAWMSFSVPIRTTVSARAPLVMNGAARPAASTVRRVTVMEGGSLKS